MLANLPARFSNRVLCGPTNPVTTSSLLEAITIIRERSVIVKDYLRLFLPRPLAPIFRHAVTILDNATVVRQTLTIHQS